MAAAKKFVDIARYLLLLLYTKSYACHQFKPLHTVHANHAEFSLDDILNSRLISTKFATDQSSHFLNCEHCDKNQMVAHVPKCICFNSTDLGTAIETMRYHRHMMKKYLLSGYLSKEIINSIPTADASSEAIGKRSGKAGINSDPDISNVSNYTKSHASNYRLTQDPGSSQYLNWLKRMITFDDIQKHLLDKAHQNDGLKRKFGENHPTYGEDDIVSKLDYSDEGDITGYAFSNNQMTEALPDNLYKTDQNFAMKGKSGNLYNQALNKVGYNIAYNDYSAPPRWSHNYDAAAAIKQTREIGIKDITDIALTTLAFLSFGTFILQVLMCLTMTKDNTGDMVMLPVEGTDNGDIPDDGNTEEIRRKRSISSSQIRDIQMINNSAKRALFLLNAVLYVSEDGGSCHCYSLCETNKFTGRMKDLNDIWIPAWRYLLK